MDLAEMSKTVEELNDLVRGSVDVSKKAADELKAAVEQFDAQKQAVEQLRADSDAMAKDLRLATKQIAARVGSGARYRGLWADEEQARRFGLMFMARVANMPSAQKALKEEGIEVVKAMGEGTEAAGGFLVPPEYRDQLIRNVELYGTFRKNAGVVPMSRDVQNWPKRTGGLTVYNPAEAGTITASDATLANVELTAKKFATLTAISSELAEDAAVAIGELLAMEISLAFATKEDDCGFVGDGTSSYFGVTGVLNHASTVEQAAATGDDTFAEACGYEYLAGALGQVEGWALVGASYYFHRSVFFSNVVGLIDSTGQPVIHFMPPGQAAGPFAQPLVPGGPVVYLLGFPVQLTSSLPSTSDDAVSTSFWAFGSLGRAYYLGERRQMEIAQSKDVYFATDQIGIRGTERIAISAADATAMCKTTTAAS